MSITAASTVALALLDARDGPMLVHSVYTSGLNLRCGDYLVHASTHPHGGACSLGMTSHDLQLLGDQAAWGWTTGALVALDGQTSIGLDDEVERYATSPPHLSILPTGTSDRLEHARGHAGRDSWFDAGPGRSLGLPRLREAIGALVGRRTDALERIRKVVGLGAGLTPSADDALIGALCLLSATGTASTELRQQIQDWLHAEGRASTTDVSLSYLRLALGGEFSTPVNRAVGCLTESSTDVQLEDAVRRLGELGATSGMDTVLGIRIACEFLTRPSSDRDPY